MKQIENALLFFAFVMFEFHRGEENNTAIGKTTSFYHQLLNFTRVFLQIIILFKSPDQLYARKL